MIEGQKPPGDATPMKAIAIDIDDTLNNFSKILQTTAFFHNPSYPVSSATFHEYLEMVRKETADEDILLSPDFIFCRQKIHGECYERALARRDGVEFAQWLRQEGWRIVICTQRDLRRTDGITRKWLAGNGIPFDYLFIAVDKLGFCNDWGIEYLVDDHLYSVRFAEKHGVNVFYPIMAKHQGSEGRSARGFRNFEEVKRWIRK